MESVLATSVFYAILALVVLGVYLTPVAVAARRKSSRIGRVLAFNFLLGWFPLTWAWALVMAITSPPENTDRDYQ